MTSAPAPVEAGRYQVLGCDVAIVIGGEGGVVAQQSLLRICREFGRRLVERAEASVPPITYEFEAEGTLAAVEPREPPTSRPRLRSPERRGPRMAHGSVPAQAGARRSEPADTRGAEPEGLEDPEEIGAAVMGAIIELRPRVPLPTETMVGAQRNQGLAGLYWRFESEQAAFAFRAGILQGASAHRTAP